MLSGKPAPIGPARRGARPAPFSLAAIDDPDLPPVLAELAAARADALDADTVNRGGLLRILILPPPRRDPEHLLWWSTWRRRHQHRARLCHRHWHAYASTTP